MFGWLCPLVYFELQTKIKTIFFFTGSIRDGIRCSWLDKVSACMVFYMLHRLSFWQNEKTWVTGEGTFRKVFCTDNKM